MTGHFACCRLSSRGIKFVATEQNTCARPERHVERAGARFSPGTGSIRSGFRRHPALQKQTLPSW